MRSGEFVLADGDRFDANVHLCVSDVSFDNDSKARMMSLRIKSLKTDPFRLGVTIYFPRTFKDVCPVESLMAYLKQGGMSPGPLFRLEDKQPLMRSKFIQLVRRALHFQGIDCSKYSGHSFRIGAATTAAHVGISESHIKMLGRWESSAYVRYIKTPRDQLLTFVNHLV